MKCEAYGTSYVALRTRPEHEFQIPYCKGGCKFETEEMRSLRCRYLPYDPKCYTQEQLDAKCKKDNKAYHGCPNGSRQKGR